MKPHMIHCLLIGGRCAGRRIDVRSDGKYIELQTLSHLKPIVRPGEEPEKVYIKEVYEIHPFQMVDTQTPDKPAVIAIGVPADKKLTWAFGEMVRAYCEQTEERMKENENTLQTSSDGDKVG